MLKNWYISFFQRNKKGLGWFICKIVYDLNPILELFEGEENEAPKPCINLSIKIKEELLIFFIHNRKVKANKKILGVKCIYFKIILKAV